MIRYFLKRLALVVPTFLGITVLCFALTQVLPGGPVEQRLAELRGLSESASPGASAGPSAGAAAASVREQIRKHYGFDRPIGERYWNWLVHERCGLRTRSFHWTDKTAWELIADRIPVSLWFGIPGFLLAYLICVPLGIAKALRRGTAFDWASSALVFAGYAIPAFALGMLLKTLLCGTSDAFWDVLPLGGFESDGFASLPLRAKIADRFAHMVLPIVCYMAGSFAMLTLLVKNSLLDQLGADYVRTVLARGASMRRAVWAHALRNALVPVATGFGGVLAVFFAGSVIIESVFDIPGMGKLSLEALETRDYPVFLGLLSATSILGLAGQLLSDLAYVAIDPRVRFGR